MHSRLAEPRKREALHHAGSALLLLEPWHSSREGGATRWGTEHHHHSKPGGDVVRTRRQVGGESPHDSPVGKQILSAWSSNMTKCSLALHVGRRCGVSADGGLAGLWGVASTRLDGRSPCPRASAGVKGLNFAASGVVATTELSRFEVRRITCQAYPTRTGTVKSGTFDVLQPWGGCGASHVSVSHVSLYVYISIYIRHVYYLM